MKSIHFTYYQLRFRFHTDKGASTQVSLTGNGGRKDLKTTMSFIKKGNTGQRRTKAVSKHPDENYGTGKSIFVCKAEGYFGLSDFLLCLEDNAEGKACIYRISFGLEYFCTDRKRISHFRNYGR